MDGRLSPEGRANALERLATSRLDVLVVGGGVLGGAVALDAVTRGLDVGLVESVDWGAGLSGQLLYGGVLDPDRLDMPGSGGVPAVRAVQQERALLLDRIAPHLVHRVPFLQPLRRHAWDRALVGAGLLLEDTLATRRDLTLRLPAHRHLGVRTTRRLVPSLRLEGVTGAVQYRQAQVDGARLALTTVRTAAAYGAAAATGVWVRQLLGHGDRVAGVRARDTESGAELGIEAAVVVLAAGTAAAELCGTRDRIELRSGVHAVIPRSRIRSSTGLVLPGARGRLLVTPWQRHWIAGRLGQPDELGVEDLLTDLNHHLARPLAPDDVQSTFIAQRPDREGTVAGPRAGLLVVSGGRVPHRLLAARAVDAAVSGIGGLHPASITDRVLLLGADGYHARWNQRHLLARRAGLHVAQVERLLNRYGSMVDHVLDLVTDVPALAAPVPGTDDLLAAEVRYAVSHEGARSLADVLLRRTRVALQTWDHAAEAAPVIADLMAGPLGWADAETSRQISAHLHSFAISRDR